MRLTRHPWLVLCFLASSSDGGSWFAVEDTPDLDVGRRRHLAGFVDAHAGAGPFRAEGALGLRRSVQLDASL